MTNDIVARLRDCTCVPHGEICREAADEIERLRADRDEAEPLLEELWQRRTESTEMRAEIERLRKERDELRGDRETMLSLLGIIADIREAASVGDRVMLGELAEQIGRIRAERDEARQERDGYLEGNRQTLAALAEANEIAKRYKSERDEARRKICEIESQSKKDAEIPFP